MTVLYTLHPKKDHVKTQFFKRIRHYNIEYG